MTSYRPQCTTRIDTRLENFLSRQLGFEDMEVYEQESCVEEITGTPSFMKKYPFRILIVCKDRIYITDNPPKNLDNFICFEDILDIKTVDDIPKFLKGKNQQNALHLSILYVEDTKKKKDLLELKKRIVNLKKNMLYSKIVDEKIVGMEMIAPLSFRSEMSTFRSMNFDFNTFNTNTYENKENVIFSKKENLNDLTNRTIKSVHFDETGLDLKDAIELDTTDNDKLKTDRSKNDINERITTQHYKKLLERTKESTLNPLSLSLPLTERSLDSSSTTISYMSKEASKSLEDLNHKINREFMKDTEKKEYCLELYLLNPKTKMYQTLKIAHFYSKIRETLNFHNIDKIEKTAETKSNLIKKINISSTIEKKFKQLKVELFANIDDLDLTAQLFDELLCATNSNNLLKKFFWNTSEFYKLTVNQINRYLPKSPANMKSGGTKAASRRIKELECSIAFIECLSVMLSETEFYQNRNEILVNEKCQILASLVKVLTEDPEIAFLNQVDYNQEHFDLNKKMEDSRNDLSLVSAILLWEILHFLNLSSWDNEYFNFDTCVQSIENSKFLEKLIHRLIGELSEIITYNNNILLSAQQTVIIYKIFSLFKKIIDKSAKKILKTLLRQNYQEEFKYYFSEQKIKSRCFDYYPITQDLLKIVRKLEDYIS